MPPSRRRRAAPARHKVVGTRSRTNPPQATDTGHEASLVQPDAAISGTDVSAITAQIAAQVTETVMANLRSTGLLRYSETTSRTSNEHTEANLEGSGTNACVRGPNDQVISGVMPPQDSSSMPLVQPVPYQGNPRSFVSSRLPIHFLVPQKTKERIWRDEFIELSSIMEEEADICQLTLVKGAVVQKLPSKKRFMSIEQWTDAFSTFSAVYRIKNPEATEGLAAYMELVRKIAKLGGNWYFYDTNFRKLKRSANYTWFDRDDELFLIALQKKSPSRQPFRASGGPGTHQNGQPSAPGKRFTSCKKYNMQQACNGCKWPHICYHCGGSHPKQQCKGLNSRSGHDQDSNPISNQSTAKGGHNHGTHPNSSK